MPLYEYKCDRCGDLFEVIEKFSDAPLEEHPGCGGHVERQLSVSALQFKGTGWYVTDYARNSGNGGRSSKGEKGEKNEKSERSEKSEKNEKSEKKDSGASTVNTESASKPASSASDKK